MDQKKYIYKEIYELTTWYTCLYTFVDLTLESSTFSIYILNVTLDNGHFGIEDG